MVGQFTVVVVGRFTVVMGMCEGTRSHRPPFCGFQDGGRFRDGGQFSGPYLGGVGSGLRGTCGSSNEHVDGRPVALKTARCEK